MSQHKKKAKRTWAQITALRKAAFDAAAANKLDELKFAIQELDEDFDIENKDSTDRTILMVAAHRGCEQVVEALLEMKAESVDGLLNSCMLRGHPGVCRLLIEKGGHNPNEWDDTKRPVLMNAILNRQVPVAHALIKAKANPSVDTHYGYQKTTVSALSLATVLKDDFLTVRLMIEAKVDVNQTIMILTPEKMDIAKTSKNWADQLGNSCKRTTLLSWAISRKDKEMIKLLVKAPAKINTDDTRNLFDLAYKLYDYPFAKWIKDNIQGDMKDLEGMWSAAAYSDNPTAFRWAIENGVDINVMFKPEVPFLDGAIAYARCAKSYEVIEFLASLGGECTDQAKYWAANHAATFYGRVRGPVHEQAVVEAMKRGKRGVRRVWSKCLAQHLFGNLIKIILTYADPDFSPWEKNITGPSGSSQDSDDSSAGVDHQKKSSANSKKKEEPKVENKTPASNQQQQQRSANAATTNAHLDLRHNPTPTRSTPMPTRSVGIVPDENYWYEMGKIYNMR